MRIIYEFNANMRRDYENKKTSQKPEEIYSKGESSDSPGGFGYQRARKINSRTL